MKTQIKLTVFFEGIFWVGVFEKISEERYEAARVVFGSEPKDYEVYDFILKNFNRINFISSTELEVFEEKRINPKRLQREVKKEVENSGASTKAQLAVKEQYEQLKLQRKMLSKEEKEEQLKRKFDLRQQKKKEKHRGH
ncbi:YjdF family protein [Clostridium sp. YIM B02515]|uniref:YjdF family protein n=1 Tax=Clostridium rhizosphaerae TaxID=2803861 RepID=A0ABS1TA61_9CLOT|nr:YjdF family protein [Clostridium rhizosphaerae]MBL4935632.1 YjdF family protein [Clostridium rhizosphaerae]